MHTQMCVVCMRACACAHKYTSLSLCVCGGGGGGGTRLFNSPKAMKLPKDASHTPNINSSVVWCVEEYLRCTIPLCDYLQR